VNLASGGHFTAILVIGVAFVTTGLALALNVRGLGTSVVRLIFALSGRDVPVNHLRILYLGWGTICVAFGSGALLIGLRVLT
jgi:hypothetical protein